MIHWKFLLCLIGAGLQVSWSCRWYRITCILQLQMIQVFFKKNKWQIIHCTKWYIIINWRIKAMFTWRGHKWSSCTRLSADYAYRIFRNTRARQSSLWRSFKFDWNLVPARGKFSSLFSVKNDIHTLNTR